MFCMLLQNKEMNWWFILKFLSELCEIHLLCERKYRLHGCEVLQQDGSVTICCWT